jgi:hypothetical protein
MTSPNSTELLERLQRRIARLLLRHDRATFCGHFRELYARSCLPQADLLRAYDLHTRAIVLADALFDNILPRIRRQLSFHTSQLRLDEEPPLRGQIDWRRTLERSWAERPDQPPLRFATRLRQRSFATPENALAVAVLRRYAALLDHIRTGNLLSDTPLSCVEQRDLLQLKDRVRRELASPQFQELAQEIGQVPVAALVEQVGRRLRSGANPYRDLIDWWQQLETLHIRGQAEGLVQPTLDSTGPASLLYPVWVALELVDLLAERGLLEEARVDTDQLHLRFQWQERGFNLVYGRPAPAQVAWGDAARARASFWCTRADPIVIRDGPALVWQEPGVLLNTIWAPDWTGDAVVNELKWLLAELQMLDGARGVLILPDAGSLSPLSRLQLGRCADTAGPDGAVQLCDLRPLDLQEQPQTQLAHLLDRVAAWLPVRPAPDCYGRWADPETQTPTGQSHPREAPGQQLLFCPKPHISPNHIDLVNPASDCLQNRRLCHLMSVREVTALVPPFVRRVRTQAELLDTIRQLRAQERQRVSPEDDSPEAEQIRSGQIEALGKLVDSYRALNQPDVQRIEALLRWPFGRYWSNTDEPKRGLPEEVRNMLISGEFVWDEFHSTTIQDWAACAVQYVRAVEYELKRRIYDRCGHPSALVNRRGEPLQPREFTFGTVNHAYQKRNRPHPNWSVILQRAAGPCQADARQFEQVIGDIVKLHQLRNMIAHSEQISQATATMVHDVTIGNPQQNRQGALPRLVAMLDG